MGLFRCALGCVAAVAPALGQQGAAPAGGPGGYLGGSDDCAAPHVNLGAGDLPAVPFTTGTTGTTGQTEAICYASSQTGIDADVWFDWTVTVNGMATLSTCGGTIVDTKVAIWPDSSPASCPAAGTALACNDDDITCSLQSTVSWPVSAATTYTIQLGTFPGASAGSGTFELTEVGDVGCQVEHDGAAEQTLGLGGGGELGWMHFVKCIPCFTWVQTAYGDVANGSSARVVVYEDMDRTDRNPGTNTQHMLVLSQADTVVANAGMSILNCVRLETRVNRDGLNGEGTWILATSVYAPGESPAPIDMDTQNPHAWYVAAEGPGAMLDVDRLERNSTPPTPLAGGSFLLESEVDPMRTCLGPGEPVCFGDGSGAACGCGNESPGCERAGCVNGHGVPAMLTASGSASISNDSLVLTGSNVTAQPGLFFQGDNLIAGGAGVSFGDGVRCCGTNVVRLQVVNPPGAGPTTTSSTVSIAASGGVSAGDLRCYQYWYRDTGGSSCGSGFNLTNAAQVLWEP